MSFGRSIVWWGVAACIAVAAILIVVALAGSLDGERVSEGMLWLAVLLLLCGMAGLGGLAAITIGRAEQPDRSERALFQRMLDSVGVVSWEADARTLKLNSISPQIEALLGIPPSAWLADGGLERMIHDRDRAHTLGQLRELASRGSSDELEFRVRHSDGTTRWLRSIVTLDRDAGPGGRGSPVIRGVMIDVTDTRKTHKRLQESERRFQTMANQTPTLIWMADQNGKLQFVNQTWLDFTGKAEDEVLGDRWQSLISPEHLPRLLDAIRRASEHGEPYVLRYCLRHRDGGYRWVYERGAPLTGEGDEMAGLIGSAVDIDDMVRAENALRESQQRMKFHIERTPLAYIEVDAGGRIVSWNESAARIFGYTAEQAYGQDIIELLASYEGNDRVRELVGQLLHKAQANASRNENVRADGQVIVCEWFNTPLVDSNGVVTGFASMADDITKRVNAERRIRESETLYRLLAENAADLISRHTISGQNTYISPASRRLLGREPEELLGMRPCDLVHPDDVAGVQEFYRQLLAGDAPPSLRFRVQHRDGHYVFVEIRPQIVGCDEQGDDGDESAQPGEAEIVCVTRDITPQVLVEEALRRSQAELRTITDALPVVIGCLDCEYRFRFINAEGVRLYNTPVDGLIGVPLSDVIPAERLAYHKPILDRAIAGEPVRYEYTDTTSGAERVLDITVIPDRRSGAVEGVFFLVNDVTAQRQAARQIEIDSQLKGRLLSELNHRLKNALSSLLSLIEMCRLKHNTVEGFANAITRRVKAMNDVHSLLSAGHYSPIELQSIILTMVPPESPGRISISGPRVLVSSWQATPLGFVIQELMSNSLKYGAMSSNTGQLLIMWRWLSDPAEFREIFGSHRAIDDGLAARSADHRAVSQASAAGAIESASDVNGRSDRDWIVIEWFERGYTHDHESIVAGLGTELIKGFVKHELRGELQLTYQPDGVSHRLAFRPSSEDESHLLMTLAGGTARRQADR